MPALALPGEPLIPHTMGLAVPGSPLSMSPSWGGGSGAALVVAPGGQVVPTAEAARSSIFTAHTALWGLPEPFPWCQDNDKSAG